MQTAITQNSAGVTAVAEGAATMTHDVVEVPTRHVIAQSATTTADPAYLLQLAAYRLAVQRIFPGMQVRAAILWTDGPRIMEIPADLLDARQRRLWQLEEAAP